MKDYEEKVLNIMDNAKDNIRTQLDKAYKSGYEDGKKALCDCEDNMECEYNRGLNDAWKAAKWLYNTQVDFVEDMFNCEYWEIYSRFTVQKVLHKIKEYEEQQKQDTEIKVGDEVITKFGTKGIVITDIPSQKGDISVWLSTCNHVQLYPVKDLVKTGRHFDQIAEVLAEMRGESE